MAHIFRDEFLSNLTIDLNNIGQISDAFAGRNKTLVQENSSYSEKNVYFTYIIRFDNKGYRLFSYDELKKYFEEAKDVERIIFTVETAESLNSNRLVGTYKELRLDAKDHNASSLVVTADDKNWVDTSFSTIQDVLKNSKNKNGYLRTPWTQLVVQIIGVVLGFILSLWAASKISPNLRIENPLLISFIFVFLLFSNIWVFLNTKILSFIDWRFPNIKFYRSGKDEINWIINVAAAAIIGAGVLYLLGKSFTLMGEILGSFINNLK